MPWVAPKTDFVNGDVLTATQMNNIGNDLAMLNGGTTGQVLSKASNANGDFAWTSETDPNAIPKTLIDAKGDLIAGSAADTAARLAVGTNGQVLTADSTTATGLKWATASAGGGMTLIATATPSAATTVSFTSIPTTYKQLQVIWTGIYTNSIGNYFGVRLNNDSGTNYTYFGIGSASGSLGSVNGTNLTIFGQAGDDCPIGHSPTSLNQYSNHGAFTIFNADQTTNAKLVWWGGRSATSTANTFAFGGHNIWGRYSGTSAISRIDFIRSGTETITGTFYLYGIA